MNNVELLQYRLNDLNQNDYLTKTVSDSRKEKGLPEFAPISFLVNEENGVINVSVTFANGDVMGHEFSAEATEKEIVHFVETQIERHLDQP